MENQFGNEAGIAGHTKWHPARVLNGFTLPLLPRRHYSSTDYAPQLRTLHLIDIENLMGGPRRGPSAVETSWQLYKQYVRVRANDHVITAANGALALHVGLQIRGQLLVGNGPDGADRALLARISDTNWVALRYDRVIVGSGDGIFVDAVRELARNGVQVGVASRRDTLARELARSALFLVLLPGINEHHGGHSRDIRPEVLSRVRSTHMPNAS
jgi:hypothetical protein